MKTGTAATSYKKVRKGDKNKKKLKTALKNVASKTHLPKGQNLTDTNFKVKKIVIKDQVKPHEEDEILYHKKLNVTELIARLGHHSSAVKTEALNGLKDMINTYPVEVLGNHYVHVLEVVAKLVLDDTSAIRRSSCRLVRHILSAIPRQKLVPIFASLNSYLLCGLTHIDRGIREDSLIFLDACLKYVPALCEKYAFNLLFVCLDMISNKGVASRTLSLNLESSQTTVKWRMEVLERIGCLLHCLAIDAQNTTEKPYITVTATKNFLPGSANYMPIYTEIAPNQDLAEHRPDDYVHHGTTMDFAEAIIPLLFGIFQEVSPLEQSTVDKNLSTDINEESSRLLTQIVDIILTLWEIVDNPCHSESSKILAKRFARPLLQNLVAGRFPYCIRSKLVGENQKSPDKTLLINLSVARLVLLFTDFLNWDPVLPFLKKCFRMTEQFSSVESAVFAACMKVICGANGLSEQDYFFSKIIQTCLAGKSQLCPYFCRILGDIALSTQMQHLHGHPEFKKWLSSLPERLTQDKVQMYQADIISKIAVRNFPSFANSLDVNVELILDNIPNISIGDNAKKEALQWQMATLLHWVPNWDEELSENLLPAIQTCYWGERLTKYISEIISMKDATTRKRRRHQKKIHSEHPIIQGRLPTSVKCAT